MTAVALYFSLVFGLWTVTVQTCPNLNNLYGSVEAANQRWKAMRLVELCGSMLYFNVASRKASAQIVFGSLDVTIMALFASIVVR